jgi:hypothetical protein
MNKKLLSIGLLCLLTINTIFAKDIYVTKTGNDNNAGTQAAPYLTISKAAQVAVAGDNVFIGAGTYEETLKPSNSGTASNPIVFQSIPGEKVIITAMQALSGWTSDGNGIWKTTINWDLGQRNFVMRGTTVLDLARWPNNTDGDRFTLNSVRNDGGSEAGVDANAFLTDTDIPNWNWSNGGSILFYGDRSGSGWSTWKAYIKGQSQGKVVFDANKNVNWIMNFHPPVDKGDFYLEGIKEALDYQNEWYFNPTNKTLFIKLPNNAQPKDGEVQMSRRTTAIDLEGRNYIHIKNLAVFGGSILINGTGSKISNSKVLYGSMTRGIEKGISSGVNAVFVKNTAQNTIIEKCEIGYGDGSGVWDSGKNTIIQNNYVHDFNYVGMYDGPVMARAGGSNTKVLNNKITKGGRDAIQITNPGSEVAWNDISFSNLIADDCALLYTIGPNLNMDIHHNWFHDAVGRGKLYKAAGIYLDNDASGVRIYRNVVWNVEWTNIQINWNGTDIDVFNNTLCKADKGTMGAWHKAGTAFSNVKVWNNITDKQATSAGGQETETTWEPQSDKQNNIVSKESFVDWANNDFHLKVGAPAVDYGRVIAGFTDGYKGAKPDAGAYELGDNWVPGIDWDITKGPTNTCYGLPGETCSEVITPIVEAISFVNAPLSVTSSNQYTFNVNYAANEARDVIVEIKTAADVWVGRTRVSVAKGTGTTAVVVNLANALPIANGYKLSTWLVPTGLDWQAIIVSKNAVFNVEAPVVEAIKLVNTPTELKQGKVFTFDFTYTSAESRNVIVEVKNSANTWLGNVKVLVPKGTGTSSGTITFANDLPIATGYKLSTFMVPTGLDWKSTIVADNAVFKVVLVTGLESNDELENVFYPNPTTGLIHFGKELEVEVYNNLGNKLFESISSDVDLSNRAAGVYFVKVESKIYRVVKY